jgi:hypothetical protein
MRGSLKETRFLSSSFWAMGLKEMRVLAFTQ